MSPWGKAKPARGGRPLDVGYRALASDPAWVCQAKIDGWRAVWDGDALRTRSGKPIRIPPQVRDALPAGVVLEGEWEPTRGRLWLFDAPTHPGTLRERWAALQGLFCASECVQPIPHGVTWDQVEPHGWEGVVWKRLDSRYPCAGVTWDWIKYRAEWLR